LGENGKKKLVVFGLRFKGKIIEAQTKHWTKTNMMILNAGCGN